MEFNCTKNMEEHWSILGASEHVVNGLIISSSAKIINDFPHNHHAGVCRDCQFQAVGANKGSTEHHLVVVV